MKKRALTKEFFTAILKTRSRFLSIMLITALGVAFFAGVRATEPDMQLSADTFYDEKLLQDLYVTSTLGITDDDIEAIASVEGVEQVEGFNSVDMFATFADEQANLQVMSISETMNILTLVDGRFPEAENECVIDVQLIEDGTCVIGDTFVLASGTDTATEDLISTEEFTIVGSVVSPYYISLERGTTSIGNGTLKGYVCIPADVFVMDYYIQAVVRVAGAAELNCYSDEYSDLVDGVVEAIEDIADERCEIRYAEIQEGGAAEIADAEAEIADAKAELADAAEELADAEEELEDGRAEIEDGKAEIEDAKAEIADAEAEIADAEAELEDAKAEVADGWESADSGRRQIIAAEKQLESAYAEYEAGLAEIEEGYEAYYAALAEVEAGYEEYYAGLAALEAGYEEYYASKAVVESGYESYYAALAEVEAGYEAYYAGAAEIEAGYEAYYAGVAAVEEGYEELETYRTQYEQLLALSEAGLADEETLYAIQMLAASIEEAEAELEASSETLAATSAELTAGSTELAASYEELQAADATLSATLAELKAGDEELAKAYTELEASKSQLDAALAELTAGEEELASVLEELKAGEEELAEAEAELDAAQAEIDTANGTIAKAVDELVEAEAEIADGEEELSDAKNELADAKAELADGEAEIADAEEELLEGVEELSDAQVEYDDAYAEAMEEIADAEAEIADAEEELADLEVPEWYVLDRDYIYSVVDYGQNAERIGAIGEVFPVIFFLVAALVCLTTMTRMVEEERTQIGTLKALGYSGADIAAKYILYALISSVIGSVAGLVLGQKLLPYVIITAYQMLYPDLPYVLTPLNAKYSVMASAAAILCTTVAAWAACYKELLAVPAQLMRPAAPKSGKRVFLERIRFLWRRLSFSQKAAIRNLVRYKKRFFMTIFGISGCMALLIVGFGLMDSIHYLGTGQYGALFMYEMTIEYDTDAEDEDKAELMQVIDDDTRITAYTQMLETAMDVEYDGVEKSAYIIVPSDLDTFDTYINLRDRVSGEEYEISDTGVIISEKLANLLDVEEGDTIIIKEDDTSRTEAVVEHVTENYFMHYIYMSSTFYTEIFGEEPEWNMIFLRTASSEAEVEDAMQNEYMESDTVSAVTFTTGTADYIDDILKGLNVVLYVLIISAGLLAFVVLYNLNNINISERKRELATLKVLGFYDGEVSAYINRETVMLTVIGIALGVVFGKYLHAFIITTVETDTMMFGRVIKLPSYIYSVLLTFLFSVVVNASQYFKLKKIDMVESMKSVE